MQIHLKFFVPVIVALFCAGCTSVPQAEFRAPPDIGESAHPAPMMFTKLKVDLPAGADVGYVSDFGLDESVWFVKPANRRELSRGISKEELSRVFSTVMEGQGYDVVDYLDPLFDEEITNEILRTEYRIGGKIIDARMDVDFESGDNLGPIFFGEEGVRGELYLKIKWSVYDALKRGTVYQTITEGTGGIKNADPEGMILLMNAAFEMAAHNLGADPEFKDLLVHGVKSSNYPPKKKHEDRPLKYQADEALSLTPKPLSTKPFAQIAEKARKATVMVQGGTGHGSGFFISGQGHIITNQHVVGNAQRVRIVTADKEDTLVAQVLRVSRPRDVALLKLEDVPADLKITTLPIRTDWPAVSEDIYAIGAPKDTRLQDTISKGIVSAHRPGYKLIGNRQDFIQGDVPIHGGNSGGPLVDAHGNLIGIAVNGLYMHEGKRSSDLNLFIPIADALKKLDITLEHGP